MLRAGLNGVESMECEQQLQVLGHRHLLSQELHEDAQANAHGVASGFTGGGGEKDPMQGFVALGLTQGYTSSRILPG